MRYLRAGNAAEVGEFESPSEWIDVQTMTLAGGLKLSDPLGVVNFGNVDWEATRQSWVDKVKADISAKRLNVSEEVMIGAIDSELARLQAIQPTVPPEVVVPGDAGGETVGGIRGKPGPWEAAGIPFGFFADFANGMLGLIGQPPVPMPDQYARPMASTGSGILETYPTEQPRITRQLETAAGTVIDNIGQLGAGAADAIITAAQRLLPDALIQDVALIDEVIADAQDGEMDDPDLLRRFFDLLREQTGQSERQRRETREPGVVGRFFKKVNPFD